MVTIMKGKKVNKIKWLHLRLSDNEYWIVRERLAKSTCRNMSQYLRDIIFDKPVVATYRNASQDDILQELAILNRQLNSLGNNMNQITKRLHTIRPPEIQSWGAGFTSQTKALTTKIIEIKEVTAKIAQRWLR